MGKYIYILLGWFFFVLGLFGFFLPVLPSVPFMLLSAFFFSKGSERLHAWLLSRPYIGDSIKEWETKRVLKTNIKWTITLSTIFMLTYPLVFLTIPPYLKLIMVFCASGGLIYIWSFPSSK